MMKTWYGLIPAGLLLLAGGSAQAALMSYESNGVQLVYDDAQDLTWVRDANLFRTQYEADNTVINDIIAAVPTITSGDGTHIVVLGDFNTVGGAMNWHGAMAWVEWLRSIDYAGADNWRLPAIIDTGAPGCDDAYVGTDCGFNGVRPRDNVINRNTRRRIDRSSARTASSARRCWSVRVG